jgi:hypothetical protein
VIDYFAAVRRARGAGRCDPMDVDDHRFHGGRSWPIDAAGDSLVRRPQRLARPSIDSALDDATGMRARMPHGRAETAVHGAVARMTTKGSAGNDRAGASRHCGGFGVEANLASAKENCQTARGALPHP